MQTKVTGTVFPVLDVDLGDGETILAEGGELSWMTPNIQMHTSAGLGGGGGVFGALRRAAGGGTVFMTEYTARGGPGRVSFAAKLPGQILPVPIEPDGLMIHRHGLVCLEGQAQVSFGFQQSFRAGLFGGEGFVLQKVVGSGTAHVELSGELVTKDLGPGEQLLVHPGHVGLFPARMPFEITTVAGIANKIFGGDGLFLARLTGPGRVLLQSLTLPRLAAEIGEYLPNKQ